MFSLYYSWEQNKQFPCLLIFFFSEPPNAYLDTPPHCFIIPNIFLLTCTKIDDLNTNIPILKYQVNSQLTLLLRAPLPLFI